MGLVLPPLDSIIYKSIIFLRSIFSNFQMLEIIEHIMVSFSDRYSQCPNIVCICQYLDVIFRKKCPIFLMEFYNYKEISLFFCSVIV